MKNLTTLAFAAVLGLAAGCMSPSAKGDAAMDPQSRRNLGEQVAAGWSDTPRMAAQAMMKRYGAPDEVGSSRLVWYGNGPWKRTIVRDLPMPYAGGMTEDLGVIEQTVSYNVSPEQASSLSPLGDRLSCDPSRMEMSSRSDREEINFLRLNLANDVVRRTLSAQEAGDAYARTLALEASGKTSHYMLGLRFGH